MQEGREIISHQKFDIVLRRLCHQLMENYDQFENACIIGLQPRGTILSNCLVDMLIRDFKVPAIEYEIWGEQAKDFAKKMESGLFIMQPDTVLTGK